VLRQQIIVLRRGRVGRLPFSAGDRLVLRWVCGWFPKTCGALAIIRPETVMRWHRTGLRSYWRWKSRCRPGRPALSDEIRRLIRDISIANPLWGAPRIHGELLKLGSWPRDRQRRSRCYAARLKPAKTHRPRMPARRSCGFKGEDGKPAFDWLTNPFMFQTLRMAIPKFMDTIAPTGDVRSPAEYEPALANSTIWGPHATPEARANYAVMVLSHNLRHAQPLSAEKALGFDMPLRMKIDIERTLNSMHQAREALIPKGG
jgi:hypothetical protein